MLIDTHTHLNFNAFRHDADEVIRRSLDNQTWLIIVGAEYKTSKRGLDYANKYERGVYATVGIHPIHLVEAKVSDQDYQFNSVNPVRNSSGALNPVRDLSLSGMNPAGIVQKDNPIAAPHFAGRGIISNGVNEVFNHDLYEKLAQFKKVVAIGEIGLDYYHLDITTDLPVAKNKQKEILLKQLKLAIQLGLPVIIHCRQAHDDLLVILKDFRKKNLEKLSKDKSWGVMHCFSGDEDLAWQYFSLGIAISFTGLITFSAKWDELIRKAPIEKILIETDSPYMTPEPHRGKRNEPVLVRFVAERIAQIKNLTFERVAEITTANARKMFNI